MPVPLALAHEALPTLLTSRPQLEYSSKDPSKAQPPSALPENYAVSVRVRNTFIDTSAERSPSLERFYREREVSTCPSAHIGRLKNLFQELDVGDEAEADSEERPQWRNHAPDMYSVAASALVEARREGAAAGGPEAPPILVLSLAEALCAPSPPQQPFALVGQDSQAGGFVDPAARAFQVPCQGVCNGQQLAWNEVPCDAACNGQQLSWTEVPCDAVCNGQQFSWSEVLPAHDFSAYGYVMTEEHPAHAHISVGAVDAHTSPSMFFPNMSAEVKAVPAPPDRPAPGSAELPSTGSAGHAAGRCKPCAFFHTVGCSSDLACQFCHLCEAGEKKRRRKEKLDARRAGQKGRQAPRQASGIEGVERRTGAGSE